MTQRCANCFTLMSRRTPGGSSNINTEGREFLLCEPCWNEEHDEIEKRQTYDFPERLARYAQNEERY